jgi:hypothetical protein
MTFNANTGTFEGTPPPGFRGQVEVRITARDSQGRLATQTFKINVSNPARAAQADMPGKIGLTDNLLAQRKQALPERLAALSRSARAAAQHRA